MEETLKLHTADGVTVSFHIAGIGSRSYAFLIDWHIRSLLALAWCLVTIFFVPRVWEFISSGDADSLETSVLLVLAPSLVIYFLYHPILEVVMKGRTLGKKMAGLRVVSMTGQTPSVGALLIRNIFRLVDSLPFGYILGLGVATATSRQVRIGDLAAGTLLVYEETSSPLDPYLFSNGSLNRTDLELLQDLLERWSSLEISSRQRLGAKFLERVDAEAIPKNPINDQDLHSKLSTLLKESHGSSSP